LPAFALAWHLRGSIPAGRDTEPGAQEFNAFSRNLEVGLAAARRPGR
jgi:hypothetical protein